MGASPSNAVASTKPMTDLLGRQISWPVIFDVEDADDLDDVRLFGEKLSQGKYHLGALWGIEFGWLKAKFPDLEPLVIPWNGQVGWDCQLMVRRETAARAANRDLAPLKGTRLVHFQREPLMYQLSLEKVLKREGFDPSDFFQVVDKKYPTAKEAVMAVNRKEGDCIFLDIGQFAYLGNCFPKLTKDLVVLRHGPTVPPPVIAGRVENLEKLRPRLWRDLQQKLLTIHETEQGKQCVLFWRLQRFEKPDEAFDKRVAAAVRDLQLESRHYARQEP